MTSSIGTLSWRRLEVSGGFLLLTAVLYYFDTDNLLLIAFFSSALHELGHLLAIYLLGGRVAKLRLTCMGAEIVLSARRQLAHWKHCIIALAGPGTNLALILLLLPNAGHGRGYLFIGVNFVLCVFNLLPISQLDGGRVLWYFLSIFLPEDTAGQIVGIVSLLFSLGLTGLGFFLLFQRAGSFTLLLSALWLAGASLLWWRETRRTRRKRRQALRPPRGGT